MEAYLRRRLQDPAETLPIPFWEGDIDFHLFEIGIRSKDSAELAGNDRTSSPVVGYVVTADQLPGEKRLELHYVYKGGLVHDEDVDAIHNLNSGVRFSENDSAQWTFVKPFNQMTGHVTVKWKDIVGFQFEKWGDNDWRIDFLAINAFGLNG